MITGLFVVLLVTTLVTLTVSDARRSLEVTQYASFRTQAYFEARSAVERGLKSLNENSTWDTDHRGQEKAFRVESGQGVTTWAWTEPGPDSEQVYLRARALVNHTEVVACELLTRRHPVDGISLALWEPDGLDTIFIKKNSASTWDHVGPPPRSYWTKDGSGLWTVPNTEKYADGKDKYVGNLRNTVGDAHGNVFASWSRDGDPDMVYRMDGQTKSWSLLPGVPRTVRQGSQFVPTGDLVGSLEHLAHNGEDCLYALNEQDGADAITVLDTAHIESGWKSLPPAPKRYYEPQSGQWILPEDKYAKSFADISVDKKGHVYGKLGVEDRPDSIYRFVPDSPDHPEIGTWQNLPPIPQGQWHLGPGGKPVWEAENKFVGKARQLTVSSDGRVVVRQSRDGVDTLYAFTPGESSASGNPNFVHPGSWEPIKPAPRVYYNGNHERRTEPGFSGDFNRHATDHEGRLITSWSRDGYDTLFQYDFEKKAWTDLPPVERVRYDVDADHNLVAGPPNGWITGIKSLGGAGLTDTGKWEYQSAGKF
jgi:hypothetical protein